MYKKLFYFIISKGLVFFSNPQSTQFVTFIHNTSYIMPNSHNKNILTEEKNTVTHRENQRVDVMWLLSVKLFFLIENELWYYMHIYFFLVSTKPSNRFDMLYHTRKQPHIYCECPHSYESNYNSRCWVA